MSTRFNYVKITDGELEDALFTRKIEVPKGPQNRIIRKHAIALLRAWEEQNPEVKPDRKVRVIFQKPSHEHGSGNYISGSLNGIAFQAPYDKEVEVRESILNSCIKDARLRVYNPDGTVEETQLHPYTFLGYVEEEEKEIDESEKNFKEALLAAEKHDAE